MASVGTNDGLAEAVPSPCTQRLGSGDALRAPLPNPHLLALDPPATRYWPPTLPISDLLFPISCEAPLCALGLRSLGEAGFCGDKKITQ